MEQTSTVVPSLSGDLISFIEEHSKQKISHCYQCGKCTGSCPCAWAMDFGPRQLIRALQLGLEKEILKSVTIWLCLFCQTCTVRCPQQIDMPALMESIRCFAISKKIKPAQRNIYLFHKIFLSIVKRYGRLNEMSLAAQYNLQSRQFFFNITKLPQMLTKGKLRILPHKVKWPNDIKKFFRQVKI